MAPTLSGRLTHDLGAAVATRPTFQYCESYLAHRDGMAIDPLGLPLREAPFVEMGNAGAIGAIEDALPEHWGRHVIDRAYGQQSSPVDYLLKSQQDHVGHLAFSESAEQLPEWLDPWDRSWLQDACRVVSALDLHRPLPPELERQLLPNTGLGGARPKITVADGGQQFLVKFPSRRDSPEVPMARLEAAALTLANRCGIRTVVHEVVSIADTDLLLVRRFDRTACDGGWTRDAFLSARTLLANGEAAQRYSFFGSYPRFARELGRLSARGPADRRELFRRMVFNAVIGNGDDHDRNHGMLADEERPDAFRLAPAYDIVPALRPPRLRQQALGVGDLGAWSTRENMLSAATSFDLDEASASAVINEVEEAAIDQWTQSCRDQGLSAAAVSALAACVQRIPDSHLDHNRSDLARGHL
ncbi:type II toxin-antitoxin system HipA family toxin [Roseateles chitinivorans]|uniref:type II toxin-antitoxin system HipA family toxin n=1 Tax=Roseateles chitinivorans TaxID=2917965 RepID=UPI003D6763AF